jgi:ferredoxin
VDATLIIDRNLCAGTGVCVPIAAPHVELTGDTATVTVGTTLPLTVARAAAECCPQQAITVVEQQQPNGFSVDGPIVTLGPAGTDAQAEATKHSRQVKLVGSFAIAMGEAAADPDLRALLAAGYLALDDRGRAVDSWADQHFTHTGVLALERCWESLTKPMCVAVRRDLSRNTAAASVAVHPATRVFATQHLPHAQHVSFNAKPLAAKAAARGEVDACVASVDVVVRFPQLRVVEVFRPTMVWTLYRRADRA